MKMTGKKRFAPRRMRASEKPMNSRSRAAENARLLLLRDLGSILKEQAAREPAVEKHNAGVELWGRRELERAAASAKRSGSMLSLAQRLEIHCQMMARMRSTQAEVYYRRWKAVRVGSLQRADGCTPDIDQISPFSISPGYSVELVGTCFGPSQGKVLAKISAASVIELEVLSWSDTRVVARVNRIIGDIPLRPYYGKIWLMTGAGVASNTWPIQYYPVYGIWIAMWLKRVSGGVFGNSANGTLLAGAQMGDTDFTLERVERSHSGSGWSALRSPMASGQSMAQGWHIGVGAGRHAMMSLLYRVKGPKGIPPTYFSALGAWGYLGDVT